MKLRAHVIVPLGLAVCTLFSSLSLMAQEKAPTAFWPDGVEFDTSITAPKDFLGFEVGHRHMTHAQLVDYLENLAEESDRVAIQRFGKTHGGRPQLMLTITSPENHKQLNKIQQAHKSLTKPDKSQNVELKDLPAVINMGYGVHGDEPSATNVSPLVAHYLAAAQGEEINQILDNCVVLLDPSLNPDGFNRFANWVNAYRGRIPNSDPNDAEHNQGWPPGRVNYYWFDLNRDWLPAQHPESRNRLRMFHKWKPNVVLDFHEMGTNSTYFFQPGIPQRTNPLTPQRNVELTNQFGRYHADALDQKGTLYFTQERFDDFYMGKGSTYPDLHGAVGILFEQASSRGHVQRNQDGLLKFYETIGNQFTTSLSSLRATTDLRMDLLRYKKKFYRDGVELAKKFDGKTLAFSCKGNRNRLQAFADVLLRHEIDCFWLNDNLPYGDETIAAGSLVVPVRQPEFRFLQSLLMTDTTFKENIFYDVSTWTLPLAFNLNQQVLKKEIADERLEKAKIGARKPMEFQANDEALAYLIEWNDDEAPRLAWQLFKAGARVRATKGEIITEDYPDRVFGRGTLQVFLGTQDIAKPKLMKVLKEGAKRGVAIYPVRTGLTPVGSDLGSSDFPVLKKPVVATVVGRGISNYEAGEFWHLMDTKLNMPITMLPLNRVSRTGLNDYTTLVMVSGSYDSISEGGWNNIRDWVSEGGTAVVTGRGASGLLRNLAPGYSPDSSGSETETEDVKQKPFADASKESALKLISGSIFETQIDRTHPLFFGFADDTLPVFRNHTSNISLSSNPYQNPGIYTDKPLMAGYASDENVDKIADSASVRVIPSGRGRIVVISDNPNFRAFWYGTRRVLLNAIFFGQMIR